MSCSCAQQSNARIVKAFCAGRVRPNGPGTMSSAAGRPAANDARCVAMTCCSSSVIFCIGHERRVSTATSMNRPTSPWTCARPSGSSCSGCGQPSSVASSPVMCEMLSFTLQPGRSVARASSSAAIDWASCAVAWSVPSHASANASMVGVSGICDDATARRCSCNARREVSGRGTSVRASR